MVYCVGLTGNVASGKTTVSELFANLGVDVINADVISKALTAKNQAAYNNIVAYYGPDILRDDGELNRHALRDIIFSNRKARKWLEALLHPLIRQKIETQVALCATPYCIIEIPLLVDRKTYPYLNRVLLVHAPVAAQVSRVMQRDACSKAQAQAILSAQPDMKLRMKHADDMLNNDSGFNELKDAVTKLHHQYLQESSKK